MAGLRFKNYFNFIKNVCLPSLYVQVFGNFTVYVGSSSADSRLIGSFEVIDQHSSDKNGWGSISLTYRVLIIAAIVIVVGAIAGFIIYTMKNSMNSDNEDSEVVQRLI